MWDDSSYQSTLVLIVASISSFGAFLGYILWRHSRPHVHRERIIRPAKNLSEQSTSPTGTRRPSPGHHFRRPLLRPPQDKIQPIHHDGMSQPGAHRLQQPKQPLNASQPNQSSMVGRMSTRSQHPTQNATPLHLPRVFAPQNSISQESSPTHSPFVPHPKPQSVVLPSDHVTDTCTSSVPSPGRLLSPARLENARDTGSGWKVLEQSRVNLNFDHSMQYEQPAVGSIKVEPKPVRAARPNTERDYEWFSQTEERQLETISPKLRSTYKPPLTLTPVRIGSDLVEAFAALSEENTNRNVETVAILAGTGSFEVGEYVVTHMIVPDQRGTHDTCEVLRDEVMPAILAEQGLLQIGWIHTHPRYEAFLSSVDVHTHFSYQMMLPESIAIVWAPTASPTFGIFSLTTEGMTEIENCHQRGFHTHPLGSTFTSSSHVSIDPSLPNVIIQDIRNPVQNNL